MDAHELDCYVRAGRLSARALHYGERLIKEGALVREVLDAVEEFIAKEGGKPAFPAQVSINSVAAHFCPTQDDETKFKSGDIVKLDVGVHIDGYVGDNALTVVIGDDPELLRLSDAAKAARDAAVALVCAGVTPGELGRTIEQEITGRGFQPIRNLSGHGLGRYEIHTSPSIPNFASGDSKPLVAGQVIAIEPFATTGKGAVQSSSGPTVFALKALRPVRSPAARETLEAIKAYGGLPFTERWLTGALGSKAKLGLLELRRAGILYEYPPLPEESKGLVAQWEHTVLVEEKGCRILTTDEGER